MICYTNKVCDIRKQKNISQLQMAEEMGISRRTIRRIENGEQNPSLDMAYRIALYFQLMVDEVFPPAEYLYKSSLKDVIS